MIVYITKSPHPHDEWMLLRDKEEEEKDANRMRTMEQIQWEACVQLFPQGNVDPSGNPLLAERRLPWHGM